jgi:hypothetical protein
VQRSAFPADDQTSRFAPIAIGMAPALGGRMWRATVSVIALLALAAGCDAGPSDETSSTEAAASANPEYDRVIEEGHPRLTNDDKPLEKSASTRLVAYSPGASAARLSERFIDLAKWTEIRSLKNEPLFKSVKNVTGAVASRSVEADLEGKLSIRARATSEPLDDGFKVRLVNTSTFRHWSGVTVIKEGNLTIDAAIIPYRDGAIVDATMAVKMEHGESNARDIAGLIARVHDWLTQ